MPGEDLSCFICRKHRGEVRIPGGAIYQDGMFHVGHSGMSEREKDLYLGALLIEPKRHVVGFAELTPREAAVMGMLVAALSRMLRRTERAEHVYLFRLGHHVDHLHLWLVPRYPDTPREYWGLKFDEWPDAPRGGAQAIEELCDRVRSSLKADAWLREAGLKGT
jgi:diadenosine tetraphosphate (Ap4A) HIT family hydrolase